MREQEIEQPTIGERKLAGRFGNLDSPHCLRQVG